jgi:hypothetical protein
MHARVMRDGHCVFEALAMNDVVVNRGATSAWWNCGSRWTGILWPTSALTA